MHSRPADLRAPSPLARRVHLRLLAGSDAAAFVAAVMASRRVHRAWVNPPDSPEEFQRRLPRQRLDASRVSLVAVRIEDGALVGAFNLSEIVRGPLQQAYLGYYAFAPHDGHGYMGEGLRLVLDYAFRTLRLHRIEANIQPDNGPSIALVRSAGFSKEGFSPRYLKIGGRWRDHERWAINADSWRARKKRPATRSV
ncbi:MAG: GNAT family protein [Betaproteobacteria bacterium]